MSSRRLPTYPEDRDLYGPEVYTQSDAEPREFAYLFSSTWSLRTRKTRSAAGLYQQKMWTFLRCFCALYG